MATYVLVHGGGHGGWCYQKVRRLLRGRGPRGLHADAHRPRRAVRTSSARPSTSTTHIGDVVALLFYEDLHDVILVGHSYGGMVITGVADRAADRIGQLVYLDAANPTNGQSLVDVAGPVIDVTREPARSSTASSSCCSRAPGAAAFYGVTDPDDLAWMDERLTGHPWRCFEQKLVLTDEDALWAIPQYHIVCTSTLATRDRELMGAARGGRPAVGHRHRPRPDDHRAAGRGRCADRGGARPGVGAAAPALRAAPDAIVRC